MSKVYIPFGDRFKEVMLNGTMTWTSRSRWFGEVGDWFEIFDGVFDIVERKRLPLAKVVYHHWEEGGFGSVEDFKEYWKKLHPKVGYKSDWMVHVHVFRRRVK